MRWLAERKHFAFSWAPSSLIVKYQCPDECDLKLDISPSTQTAAKRDSSEVLTALVNCDTVIGRRSVSSKRAEKRGWDILCGKDEGLERKRQITGAGARVGSRGRDQEQGQASGGRILGTGVICS